MRYNALRCGTLPSAQGFDLSHPAILFERSRCLSAWKSYGAQRWALRCNPSSGNLHPAEGYLLYPALPGFSRKGLLRAFESQADDASCRWSVLGRGGSHWRSDICRVSHP